MAMDNLKLSEMLRSSNFHVSENDLLRSLCRNSFVDFFAEMWDAVVPQRLHMNWHIEVLCGELQEVAERVFRNQPKEYDLIVNMPPGSTKSMICSVAFPCWVWTRFPEARTICGSYAYPLSMDLSVKCRDMLLSEKYAELFPEVQLRADQNTKGHFANLNGGVRYSVGIGGSVTGMHGHFLVIDDPIDPNMAFSDNELKGANNWMSQTLSTRKVDKMVSVTILVMQRLHQNDPTGFRLNSSEEGDVKHLCIDAMLDEHSIIQPPELKSRYVDGLMDPVRLPRSALDEIRRELGQYGFAGQFRQNPAPPGGGMFKVKNIHVGPPPPDKRLLKMVRFWDKAGTADDGAFTAGVKLGLDHMNRIWVLNVVRGQWESAERERIIRRTAELDGPRVEIGVEQEPGSGGKESAQNTIRNLMGFRAFREQPRGDKVVRADPFSVQVNEGNVCLAEAPWNASYLEELRYFPRSQYKDQVDATSGAFTRLCPARRRAGALFRR